MKGLKSLIIFLVVSILFITGIFYGYQVLYTPNVLVDQQDRVLVIPDDATFVDLQHILIDEEYVRDPVSFSFLARLMDYDKMIKPGRYLLEHDMNNLSAVRKLRKGEQIPVKITFANVRLIDDLSEKITRNIGVTVGEFKAAVVRFAMNNAYGFNEDNVRSMFIPNTYEVYFTITADDLVDRMHEEYVSFWNDERKTKADSIGLTPLQVSILASIVQAETRIVKEAPTIAGLYINRLKKDMALQADATLVFASGDFSLKRVLDVHREIDSPYNTYQHRGLPPGPINIPEITSIDAVLNYQPSDYLYMCAREDFSGYHNFTPSLTEHLNNARRYQQALTIEMRKARSKK